MHSALILIGYSERLIMKSQASGRNSRPGRGRSRSRRGDDRGRQQHSKTAPQKKGFWSRIAGFFTTKPAATKSSQRNGSHQSRDSSPQRSARKPEAVEVTS